MKNNYEILTENEKRKYRNLNIKYPFTKMKQGFNKKTNFLYKEIEKTIERLVKEGFFDMLGYSK